MKHRLALLGLLTLLAACAPQTTPPPTTWPTPNGSAPPGAATGPASVLNFRDDFNGDAVNGDVWNLFAQSGLAVVKDGQLELLNSGKKPNFPYLIGKSTLIPQAGPWFFEMGFSSLVLGQMFFGLDYIPAEAPGLEPLTKPFLLGAFGARGFTVEADVEGVNKTSAPVAIKVRTPFVFRVENDGQEHYRVILDGKEILLFDSPRRPSRFWFGQNPPKEVAPREWPRYLIDYVASGVLASPAPAAPLPSPSQAP